MHDLVDEARALKKNRRTHVEEKLKERFPGIESDSIVRNGRVYKVLDYILDDVDSYHARQST